MGLFVHEHEIDRLEKFQKVTKRLNNFVENNDKGVQKVKVCSVLLQRAHAPCVAHVRRTYYYYYYIVSSKLWAASNWTGNYGEHVPIIINSRQKHTKSVQCHPVKQYNSIICSYKVVAAVDIMLVPIFFSTWFMSHALIFRTLR